MHGDSQLLAAFAAQAVSVIGDLILDEYITGQAARVSREAPVIVVEEERREWLVGGAAMPALNVACLGGNARQLSVVGPDDAGRQLVGLLRAGGVARPLRPVPGDRRGRRSAHDAIEFVVTGAERQFAPLVQELLRIEA